MSVSSRHAVLIAAAALLLGSVLRLSFLDYATTDVPVFLMPWYEHARDHGIASLADAFTNYAPFYTYLVVAAAAFDGLAAPLALIKFLSYPFELGSAVMAAMLVRMLDPRPARAALAIAAVWLAPSVLHNGAFWGQCDAIWTFFLLLALWCFCRDRPGAGAIAFATACSIKLQAVFLGPLVLALVFRRTLHWAWLAAIPAVYLALAAPVLVAGRPIADVLLIYFDQGRTYRSLSMGAANLYLLIPNGLYGPGVVVGLAVSAVAGLAFAVRVARAPRLPPEHLVLAACVSLVMVPFLLPKMHDRYFYPFEILIIAFACIRPVLIPVALIAQVTSLLCYLPFDGRGEFAQPVTGLVTLAILLYLVTLLRRALNGQFGSDGTIRGDRSEFVQPVAALWFAFILYAGLLQVGPGWLDRSATWPNVPTEPVGMIGFLVILCAVVAAMSLVGRAPSRAADTPAAA